MQTLASLLVTVAVACAIARPSGPTAAPAPSLQAREEVKPLLTREDVGPLLASAPLHMLLRRYLGYHQSSRVPLSMPENYWLNEEINRINQFKDDEGNINNYDVEFAPWLAQGPNMPSILRNPLLQESIEYVTESIRTNFGDTPTKPALMKHHKIHDENKNYFIEQQNRKTFALTPLDNGYFESDVKLKISPETMMEGGGHQEGGVARAALVLEPQRQIRQNPNLSKQKNLLGPQIVNLNTAHSHKSEAIGEVTDWPHHTHLLETVAAEPEDSAYGITIIAVIGAALTTAVVGFAFGWHTLSKKAKAAADVDYPAYGVTGPTIDTSGDRKLAHSAHMYHYQHQKQQIIGMERSGLEQRNGSISDPESEEENEEGDYTVYECPGFATTGEMEVKNPLFSDDPIAATPGKCEVVKPQPKE